MQRRTSNILVGVAVVLTLGLAVLAYVELPSLLVDDQVFEQGSADLVSREEVRLKARNDVRTSGMALLTLLGVAIGSVLTWRTVRATRDGQLADRYAKAVENLGNVDRSAQLGAIFALEAVARSSRRDHPVVVQLLTDYLGRCAGTWPLGSSDAVTAPRVVQPELDAVAGALGRRRARWDDRPLDLAGYDLRNVRLSGANLDGANLRSSNLSGAFLDNSRLRHASLHGAFLHAAHLDGSDLRHADLTDASLRGARVPAADFRDAIVTRTDFNGVTGHTRGLPERSRS